MIDFKVACFVLVLGFTCAYPSHSKYYPKSYLVGGSVYSNPRYVRDGYRYIPPGQMTAMVVGDTVATNSFSGGPFQPSRSVVVPFDGVPEIQEEQQSEHITEKQQQPLAIPSEPESVNEFDNEQSAKPNDSDEPESLDVLENGTTENTIVSTVKTIPKGPVKKVKIAKSKKTPTTPLPIASEDDAEEDDDEEELSAVWPFGGGPGARRGGGLPAYNAFFPIYIGGSSSGRSRTRSGELENGYPGSATAIANAFSTGKGGVATSHATSFGDPYAAAVFRNAGLYNFKTKSLKKQPQQQYGVYDE